MCAFIGHKYIVCNKPAWDKGALFLRYQYREDGFGKVENEPAGICSRLNSLFHWLKVRGGPATGLVIFLKH
jgi:hypothetical protein